MLFSSRRFPRTSARGSRTTGLFYDQEEKEKWSPASVVQAGEETHLALAQADKTVVYGDAAA